MNVGWLPTGTAFPMVPVNGSMVTMLFPVTWVAALFTVAYSRRS